MVKNTYLVIAREVSTDATDNMNSIIKIIDKFTFGVDVEALKKAPGIVALPVQYSVATAWNFGEKLRRDTLVNVKLEFIAPSGDNLGGPEQEHLIPSGMQKVNLNFNSTGLPIKDSGIYILKAQLMNASSKKVLADAETDYEVEIINGKPQ